MNELTITLDTDAREPLYEQIYRFIRQEIRRRQMLPGERLPSSRSLSRQLNVSRSTVDLAYEQLVAEGYLESVPYKGYYVCEIDNLYGAAGQDYLPCPLPAAPQTTYQISFSPGGITPGGFPHTAWRRISRQVLQEAEEELFLQGNPQGEPGFREEIVRYLYRARGVVCEPEQIIVGAGNDYLLMLLTCILGERRRIAMENPSYVAAYRCLRSLGHEICAVSMDESGIRIPELSNSEASLVYTMPAHQFPMGTVMPVRRRTQILSWAEEAPDRYIIEDDYDSEFRYKGKPIPALSGSDRNGRVVYIGTFSRAIAPSIRISYMVLPKALLPYYEERGRVFAATVSKTDQKIMELFMKSGAFERHLNRMRSVYRQKHDCLLRELRKMSEIADVSGENAGAHVVLRLKNGLTEAAAIKRAAAAGIRVYGLSQYRLEIAENPGKSEQESHSLILGYASLSEEQIREGIDLLRKALTDQEYMA